MIKNARNLLIKTLHESGIDLHPANSMRAKPAYPYLTYNITTAYIPQPFTKVEEKELIPSNDSRFEHDVAHREYEQAQMTISISSYSKDESEAINACKETLDFFRNVGYEKLADIGLIVVEVSTMQNRTVNIVDHYEFRYGFDVRLRFIDKTEVRLDTIETFNLKGDIDG